MSKGYEKFAELVSADIRKTFPIEQLRSDIDYTLGYFQAILKLVGMGMLRVDQACILISDCIGFSSIRDIDDISLYCTAAKNLAEMPSSNSKQDSFDFVFMKIWLDEICKFSSPVRWP